jgi:hypothetical protein
MNMLSFTETVNSERLEYLHKMTPDELKELCLANPKLEGRERTKDGKAWDYDGIVRGIQRMEPKQTMKYRFAKLRTEGRRYTTNTKHQFGIQNLPSNIRGFLCPHYHDYDIVNCHFTLLLTFAEQHDLPRQHLQNYVEHRAKVLEETGKTKTQMLAAILYMDSPNLSPSVPLIQFKAEVNVIRDFLLDRYQPTAFNPDNPLSSRLFHLLAARENELLERVVSHFKLREAVLMFDGFMCRETLDLEEMRALTGVPWGVKPCDDTIEIDEEIAGRVLNGYDAVKRRFEEHSFLTINPLVFYTMRDGNLASYGKLDTFKIVHANVLYEEKGEEKTNFVMRWLRDPKRREYKRVVFNPKPGYDAEAHGEFNTFEGFAVASRPCEHEGTTIEALGLERFETHLKLLTNFNETQLHWLLNFLAHLVQFPHNNPEVAVILVGLQGCGKDTLTNTILKQLIGGDYVATTADGNQLFGQFNSLLSKKLVMSINEVGARDGQRFYQRLKEVITAQTKVIRKLYQEGVEEDNYTRLFIFSNSDEVVPVMKDDRKWIILRTSNERKDDKAWWASYYGDLKDPDYIRRIYHFLRHRDISGWNPRENIVTETKRNMLACNDKTPIDFINQFDWERRERDEDGLPVVWGVSTKSIAGVEHHYIPFADLWDHWTDWAETNERVTKKQFKANIAKVNGVKLDHRIDNRRNVSVVLPVMRKDIVYHTNTMDD